MITRVSRIIEKWARPGGDEAHLIYSNIAAAARRPEFYLNYEVEDTLDGRFDTLTLMVVLVIHRLNKAGSAGKELAQEVIDMMFADMDLSLHEIGVSENKVGKKVKTMATAFLGRMNAYSAAIDREDEVELAAALRRNLYRDNGTDPAKNGLVEAVLAQVRRLAAISDADLMDGSASMEFDLSAEGRK